MEKNSFLVQLTITDHTQKKGPAGFISIVKGVPSFILPELLGLGMAGAKAVAMDMFCKYEVHGSIRSGSDQILLF